MRPEGVTGERLPALPEGDEPVIVVSPGYTETDGGKVRPAVMLSIGRPLIEENEAGEMVATMYMSPRNVLRMVHDLTCAAMDAMEAHDERGPEER